MNLSRGIGSNNRVSSVWCPEEMGFDVFGEETGGVRAKVVALARGKLCLGSIVLSDGAVIARAVGKSSYFAGLWNLIEVEIGAATRTMAHWTRGNIEPYLRLFPVLAQLVGRVHKPKISRASSTCLSGCCCTMRSTRMCSPFLPRTA